MTCIPRIFTTPVRNVVRKLLPLHDPGRRAFVAALALAAATLSGLPTHSSAVVRTEDYAVEAGRPPRSQPRPPMPTASTTRPCATSFT